MARVMPTQAGLRRAAGLARILRRLAKTWAAPGLTRVPTSVNPGLKRTLGRVQLRPLAIQLSPTAPAFPQTIEVITHEAAHAALALAGKANATRPHGPEWRRLMALAGFPNARATRPRACMPRPPKQTNSRYQHRCPVCQTTRTAKRRVPEWRCAACVAAGLDGRLVILRTRARA
jgi:predicted SprT family Zn-dependent metalloprotease